MTFKEFRKHPIHSERGNWLRVTCSMARCKNCDGAVAGETVREIVRDDLCFTMLLQWEPENQKWYVPQPVEGRTEVGYLDDIGFPEFCINNAKVINIAVERYRFSYGPEPKQQYDHES